MNTIAVGLWCLPRGSGLRLAVAACATFSLTAFAHGQDCAKARLSISVRRHSCEHSLGGRAACENVWTGIPEGGGEVLGNWGGELGAREDLRELPHHRSLHDRIHGVVAAVWKAERRGTRELREGRAEGNQRSEGDRQERAQVLSGHVIQRVAQRRAGRVGSTRHRQTLRGDGTFAARHVRAPE